jgi:glucose/arabinose dehydrogenase
VNRIETGANYGWPIAPPGSVQSLMMTPPILVLAPGTEASGLISVAQPDSPLFGDLIVSTLGSRDLLRFRFESSGQLRLAGQLLQGRYGRIAQVASGRDGSLYFITANRDEWGEGQDVLVRVRAHVRVPHGPPN